MAVTKQYQSNKRWRLSPPPFIAAATIVSVLYIVAGFAFAGEPALSMHREKKKEDKVILTLEKAIDMALKENRDITNSEYSAESQRFNIDSASSIFDLKLIPVGDVTLNAGDYSDYNYASTGLKLQKKFVYGTSVSVGPRITRSSRQSIHQYTTDMGITITQPLLRGMGKAFTTDALQTADAAHKTSLRNLYQTRVNAVLLTISTFYDAALQKEMLDLYDKMYSRLKGHSEIARAKEKVGLSTPMDTYRVEILLNDTEDAMVTALELLQNTKDKLKLILALPQDTELDIEVTESSGIQIPTLDEAIETAMENRIEIEQINQDILEAERKALVKKQDILPDLNLILNYGRYDTDDTIEETTGLDSYRYSIGLNISSDISRTAEKAAYQQSLINIKKLRIDAENRKEDIRSQVRSQWLSLQESVKRIEIRNKQIKQGEEKLALAEVKFVHGMADNFDIIEAEKELQNARSNLFTARFDYIVGSYNLKAVSGALVPRN
ncbi:MAG: TolC family protein [Deltaproteobacteria bacterium]|nr:TolC family protein [Deltaproteobacteria bacterium]